MKKKPGVEDGMLRPEWCRSAFGDVEKVIRAYNLRQGEVVYLLALLVLRMAGAGAGGVNVILVALRDTVVKVLRLQKGRKPGR